MAKAQYKSVDNVIRKVMQQRKGVNNVSRTLIGGFIGVNNVARKFLEGIRIAFRVPSYNGQATAISEFAGYDGDTIRFSFNTTKVTGNDYVCRMYMHPKSRFNGKTLQFEYKYTKSSQGSGYMYCQVQYRDENDDDLRLDSLTTGSSFKTYTCTVPNGCDELVIGFWCTAIGSAELIIRNLTIGDVKIV